MIGWRSFTVEGPSLWNSLPTALRRLQMTLHSAHFQATTQGLSVPHVMCQRTEGTSTIARRCCGVFRDSGVGYKTSNSLTYLLMGKMGKKSSRCLVSSGQMWVLIQLTADSMHGMQQRKTPSYRSCISFCEPLSCSCWMITWMTGKYISKYQFTECDYTNTSNVLTLQMFGELYIFRSRLNCSVNSWFLQIISNQIPDCWSGNRKCMGSEACYGEHNVMQHNMGSGHSLYCICSMIKSQKSF